MWQGNYCDEGTGEAVGWSAVIAGALIGTGVALLFAPQSCPDLRGRLRDSANRAKEDVFDKGHKAWDTAVEWGKEYDAKGAEVLRDAGRSANESPKQTKGLAHEAGR